MKRTIFILAFLVTQIAAINAQQRTLFESNHISKSKLSLCYSKYKSSCNLYVHLNDDDYRDSDVMTYMIQEFSNQAFNQMSIEANYDYINEGADSMYNRFVRKHNARISKTEYLNNIEYLEVLSRLNQLIKSKFWQETPIAIRGHLAADNKLIRPTKNEIVKVEIKIGGNIYYTCRVNAPHVCRRK